ncbi:helix-turn-helix domain-containing protein [Humibacter ginsengiterrae]
METQQPPESLTRISALADPVRQRLYEFVASQDAPVGRDAAAESAGISRTLAAYHLDRLAEVGLLEVSYARQNDRTGPGAGRPAKQYARSESEVSVTVPPRDFGLLARLLATAAETDETGVVGTALNRAAVDEGVEAGRRGGELIGCLRESGYEPAVDDDGDIVLRNCPFHQVAQRQTELVCGMNHALVRGILSGAGDDPDRAELAPCPGRCCVVIHPDE